MSSALQKLDDGLARLPVLKTWQPAARLFLFVALVLVLLITPLVISMQPTVDEQLRAGMGTWSIDELQIDGKDTTTNTFGISMQYTNERSTMGSLMFREGEVTFPGLNSYSGSAWWSVGDDQLTIDHANEQAKVFEGIYTVSFSGDQLTLKSQRVYIHAHAVRLNLPF